MRIVGQAVVLFAVTNVDDMLVLALFSGRCAGRRGALRNVAAGQYLGFAAVLVVAVAAAFGATLLPGNLLRYLGLLPLALGIRAAVQASKSRSAGTGERTAAPGAPKALEVAMVTFANGGDNIGVYVPVFATAGRGTSVYLVVFLILVAGWLAAGRYLATRPVVATALGRWGHVLLPVVLIGLGLFILLDGATG